jgi:hypothetical protein
MREHHALGVSEAHHLSACLDPDLERAEHIDPEAVHAENRAGVGQLSQVVEVRGVATVTDDHLRQVGVRDRTSRRFTSSDPDRCAPVERRR